jgi:hypothetical protein
VYTSHPAPPAAAPPIPATPTRRPRRPRIDRLTVLNWLAFLAILGMTLGEGCAMQSARRREARAAAARADEGRRPLQALEAARAGCDPAAWGVGLATGAPAATAAQTAACAGRAPAATPAP